MRSVCLGVVFLLCCSLPALAADCLVCPAYVEPVEIIVPKADPLPEPATPAPVDRNGDAPDPALLEDPVLPAAAAAEADPANPADNVPLGIIGEIEPVYIETIPHAFPARIDTGASICSIDVEDVKPFERDGKPWVSFSIRHRESGETFPFERKVLRTVAIKQKEGEESQRRPMVEMHIRMGGYETLQEFSLADRENFSYQVLIGRNLLTGTAIVDVSRSNVLATE